MLNTFVTQQAEGFLQNDNRVIYETASRKERRYEENEVIKSINSCPNPYLYNG